MRCTIHFQTTAGKVVIETFYSKSLVFIFKVYIVAVFTVRYHLPSAVIVFSPYQTYGMLLLNYIVLN